MYTCIHRRTWDIGLLWARSTQKGMRLVGNKRIRVQNGPHETQVKTIRGKVQEVLGDVDAGAEERAEWSMKIKEEASLEVISHRHGPVT